MTAKPVFGINLKPGNLTAAEQKKLLAALSLWQSVWVSDEFKKRVLNFSYTATYTIGIWPFRRSRSVLNKSFRYNDGLTNAQIYERLLGGAESLNGVIDYEADICVEIDRSYNPGVIGYTNAGTVKQWVYEWFFKSSDTAALAGNMAHEYCHKLGFDHEFKNTYARQYTVPYVIGYLTAELAAKIKAPIPVKVAEPVS